MNTLKKILSATLVALVISCGSAATVGNLFSQPTVAKEATVENTKKNSKNSSKKEGKKGVEEVENTTQEVATASSTESSWPTKVSSSTVSASANQTSDDGRYVSSSAVSASVNQTPNDGSYVGNGGTVHQTAEVVSTGTDSETKNQPQVEIVVDTGVKSENATTAPAVAVYEDGTVVQEIVADLD